jgi:hypothetical protein
MHMLRTRARACLFGAATVLLLLLVCAGNVKLLHAGEERYVRKSSPKVLTFDELVQLEKVDEPSPQLATRLDQPLHCHPQKFRRRLKPHSFGPKKAHFRMADRLSSIYRRL